MMYSSLNSKVVVYDGFMKYIFADVIWFEFWMIGGYDSPDVINMNLKRISCNACLSAGRLSINDTDDRWGDHSKPGQILIPNVRYKAPKDLIMWATFHVWLHLTLCQDTLDALF